jgi:hypothetical protein
MAEKFAALSTGGSLCSGYSGNWQPGINGMFATMQTLRTPDDRFAGPSRIFLSAKGIRVSPPPNLGP